MESTARSIVPVVDEAAWLRSVQRRRILEELISSEEGYISDMKALVNVYLTLLASTPSITTVSRAAVRRNVTQILHMHEELLKELQSVIPNPDWTLEGSIRSLRPRTRHARWRSEDIAAVFEPKVRLGRSHRRSLDILTPSDHHPSGLAADTKTTAAVAKVFDIFMRRFFAYEEYGAQYEAMCHDLSLTNKVVSAWPAYEKGIEALSTLVAPMDRRVANGKKGLTFADLLIKPIQRVCKYPLLFADLCKQTPVCDDPDAHGDLAKVLFRLQETTREIDKATIDPRTRKLIETTWQLQDRMIFDDQTTPKAIITRLLGHVRLCGVLHVAYQTNERIAGQYMVCALYKSCLLLATASRQVPYYTVVAGISLANASIDESDNGRGLQCYTAPYTWKLSFEFARRVYEIILSACSAREEDAWKSHIRDRIVAEYHDLSEGRSNVRDLFCTLSLDLKPIGAIFGHPETLARRSSVHRAATIGPKANPHQVIIKNTHAQKTPSENGQSTASLPVARSQSHLSAATVPTLAPRRAERVRLESALADVWTRDTLPFPGMGIRRTENPIRASANSVMRKLSMASITSNFSKRSASYASLGNNRSTANITADVAPVLPSAPSTMPPPPRPCRPKPSREKRPRPRPALVDFHSTPAAFLPADFELSRGRTSRQRRVLNRATTATDRSSEWSSAPPTPLPDVPSSRPPTRTQEGRAPLEEKRTLSLLATSMSGVQQKMTETRSTETPRTPQKPPKASPTPHSDPPAAAKRTLRTKTKLFKFWA